MVLQKVGEHVTDIVVNGTNEGSFNQSDDSTYDISVSAQTITIGFTYFNSYSGADGDFTETMGVISQDKIDLIKNNTSSSSWSWNLDIEDSNKDYGITITRNGNVVYNENIDFEPINASGGGEDIQDSVGTWEISYYEQTGYNDPADDVDFNLTVEGTPQVQVDSVNKQ